MDAEKACEHRRGQFSGKLHNRRRPTGLREHPNTFHPHSKTTLIHRAGGVASREQPRATLLPGVAVDCMHVLPHQGIDAWRQHNRVCREANGDMLRGDGYTIARHPAEGCGALPIQQNEQAADRSSPVWWCDSGCSLWAGVRR